MAAKESPTGSSWWLTMPGILTGVAAIITAVTGLIVAFNHTSSRREPPPSTTSSSRSSSSPSSATSPSAPAAKAGSRLSGAIALPELHEVKLAGGDAVVTIVAASFEPIDADRRSVTFHVRYTNKGRYPSNFWDRSYRLMVDDIPRSPTNTIDELVQNGATKEGDVVFEVPNGVKSVVLQISAGDEKTSLPFTLP